MRFPRWATRVVTSFQPKIKRRVVEAPTDYKDLFWVGVRLAAKLSCICARQKPSQSRVFARNIANAERQFLSDFLQATYRLPLVAISVSKWIPIGDG